MISRISRRSSCGATLSTEGNTIASEMPRVEIPDRRLAAIWPAPGVWSFPFRPDLSAEMDPAIWRASEAPSIVILEQCSTANKADCWASIFVHREIVRDVSSREGRHLVLADRFGRYRLLVQDRAEALPAYRILRDEWLDLRIAAIQALQSAGNEPRSRVRSSLVPTEYQTHRLKLLLEILDRQILTANPPTLRQIATGIVYRRSKTGRAIEWKASSERRQTQRLVREARCMMTEGYRSLLTGRTAH